MKKIDLLLLFIAVILSIQTFAKSEKVRIVEVRFSKYPAQTVEDEIATIRNEFQKINSMSLKKEHFTYESSGCAEDGVVDCFFNNGKIVKIVESGAIGDGSWTDEYYYSSGKIIFCYEEITGGPAAGKVTKTAYRIYVKDGRSIKTMAGNKILSPDGQSAEAIKTGNKIYQAYKTKDFVSALCGN
jgi:hypothetical protein